MINISNVEEIKQLANRFSLLLEVNASINSTLNLDDLLRKILNVATIVVQAEASSLALIDNITNELVFNFAQGEAGDKVESLRIPIGQGIAGWVAKYGVSLNIPDARQDPRFWKGADDETQFVTKSVLCVPLRRNERIIGILEAMNKLNDGVFNDEDTIVFESLGNIASIAIENSQLYILLNQQLKKLEESNQRLEGILQQLQKSEDEVAKLHNFVNAKGTLEGKLEVFTPENLTQMLANDNKTGKLTLNGNEESGDIYFAVGKIIHARTHKKPMTGSNAFYELICIREGAFSFAEGEKIEDKTIEGSFMHLLIEALRRLDEFTALKQNYPLTKVPKLIVSDGAAFKPETFDSVKISIVRLLDGRNNIETILQKASFDRFTTLSAIDELKQSNIININ